MLKIKFTNGVEMPYNNAYETEEYYDGASRRTLTFEMSSTDVQVLHDQCTEENCEILKLINTEESITNVYDGYVILLGCGTKRKLVDDGRYEEYVELKLGKRTYIEQNVKDEAIAQEKTDAQALYTAMMTDTLLED